MLRRNGLGHIIDVDPLVGLLRSVSELKQHQSALYGTTNETMTRTLCFELVCFNVLSKIAPQCSSLCHNLRQVCAILFFGTLRGSNWIHQFGFHQ
jgi:hypothetical protein